MPTDTPALTEKYAPVLLLHSRCHTHGAELLHNAGRLSITDALMRDFSANVIRDIRLTIRNLNEVLAAFDRAEPSLAAESQRLLEERDAVIAKHLQQTEDAA